MANAWWESQGRGGKAVENSFSYDMLIANYGIPKSQVSSNVTTIDNYITSIMDDPNSCSGFRPSKNPDDKTNKFLWRNPWFKAGYTQLYYDSSGKWGYGIIQWTDPERKYNMWNYIHNTCGGSAGDIRLQLKFVFEKEMSTTTINTLKSITSLAQATRKVLADYVGMTQDESKLAEYGLEQRQKKARELYDSYKNQGLITQEVQV